MNEQSTLIPHDEAPDDIQIIELLGRFAPVPSARFYEKMGKAPWIKTGSMEKAQLFGTNMPARRILLGISVLISVLVLFGLSFFPPIRAIARQIVYSFISEQADQIHIQTTLSTPGDLFHFSDPANFPLTIQEVQERSGFNVKAIYQPPEDLKIIGSRFDDSYKAVTTLYQGQGFKLFLTQRPAGIGEDVFSIGSTAQVDRVKIGDQEGEFVMGGWKAISSQSIAKTTGPGNQTDINAIWDSNLPQFTLRWQAEGFIYELRTIGESSPSQSDLIALANELK
jgi:hypothetical protein